MPFDFSPKAPVNPAEQRWADERWHGSASIGAECLRRIQPVLPTEAFFPEEFDGALESFRSVFRSVCRLMTGDFERVSLQTYQDRTQETVRVRGKYSHQGKVFIMRVFKLSSCAITLAIMMVGASDARADLFDFESLAPTFVSPPAAVSTGALTSLFLSGPTVDVTISRLNGDRFDLVSNTGNQDNKPDSYGLISLDPFFDTDGSWVLNFSTAVTNVSLDFGDYGQDTDNLTLAAFDGADLAGTFLGGSFRSISPSLTQDFTGNTISFGALGIRSVRLSGSSSVDFDSVYFDNLNVTGAVTVPEANALTLISLALPVTGVMVSRRRKK